VRTISGLVQSEIEIWTHPLMLMTGFDLDLQLDRESDVSLVEQIREAVRLAIANGTLGEGRRLPSTRHLANSLRVNRQTAVDAYRRLEIEGLIEQRRGAGAFVRSSAAANSRRFERAPGERASRALLSYEQRSYRPELKEAPSGALDLAGLTPHERSYPAEAFAESMTRALTRRGNKTLGYGPPAGDPELREILARRLRARGMNVDATGLVIVGGAQQGLDLLFRALLDPGDCVLTEAPTYHLCLDLLAFHQARVATVPVLPREAGLASLDLEALDRALEREKPRVAYAMPTFQNPTGLSLDLATRRAFARKLREHDVVLIEDDYEGDMRHGGDILPLLSSLPEAGPSVYLGTLSKALFPGLRIGWLAGNPDVLARVAQVKRISDLSGPLLLQAVAADLLESGAYDRHVLSVVGEAQQKMKALADALQARLPEGCRLTRPSGGHVLWLEAPAPSGRAMAEAAAARGVLVTPGEAFAAGPLARAAVRLSIARIEMDDIPRAAEALAAAVESCMNDSRRSGKDVESPVSV
jgi:DNA-binding transcriptional MocR family regulator